MQNFRSKQERFNGPSKIFQKEFGLNLALDYIELFSHSEIPLESKKHKIDPWQNWKGITCCSKLCEEDENHFKKCGDNIHPCHKDFNFETTHKEPFLKRRKK